MLWRKRKKKTLEIFRHLPNTSVYPTVLLTLDQGFLNCHFADGKYNMRILRQKLVSSLSTLDSGLYADLERSVHILTVFHIMIIFK